MPFAFTDLLEEPPTSADSLNVMAEIGFEDSAMAIGRIRSLAGSVSERRSLAACLPMLMAVLRDAPAPDVSLVNFERFVLSVQDRGELFEYLAASPRAIEILVRLFVGSQFLTETLIQNPQYLRELTLHSRIADFKSLPGFLSQADSCIATSRLSPLDALRHFQRWELLRIGACDAFGLMDLRSVTRQLSMLAEAVVQVALDVVAKQTNVDPAGFSILALGKLGGQELNYSSDIDLVFVAADDPQRFWQLAQRLIVALTQTSTKGSLYRVDMRLRPWGTAGALVNSVESHVGYLTTQAELWEKQALLKARTIAGDQKVGRHLLEQAAPIVFTSSPDEVRRDVLASKLKIEAELATTGAEWGDVKSGRGSLRDIEFVTQYLQLINGGLVKEVRSANTVDALVRLAELGFLHANEYRVLADAYGLLRTIEHSLQLRYAQQTHALPTSDRELGWLARRLDFMNAEQLRKHYDECSTQVRRIFDKYVRGGGVASEAHGTAVNPVRVHRRKMSQSYTDVFREEQVAGHARLVESLSREEPIAVEFEPGEPTGAIWTLTVVGRDHPGCLSVISGLMLAEGIDVINGHVFTGIKLESTPGRARRFVDTFAVRCLNEADPEETFASYRQHLTAAMRQLYAGDADAATDRVLRQVGHTMSDTARPQPEGMPAVEITVDNESSDDFTVLHIESADTVGFLYEITNALTLSGVHIEQVQLKTRAGRVFDTLHVTRTNGERITDERGIQQLRAAIVLIKHFTHLLPQSPAPRRALRQFREFLEDFFKRDNWVEELSSLRQTNVLDALARLLGVSNFLWMDFLRLQHENLFPVVRDVERLREPVTRDQLVTQLLVKLNAVDDDASWRSALNAFKDREMFRVDMRHILDYCQSFTQFSAELSDVADVVVETAIAHCLGELARKYGEPQHSDAEKLCRLSVCALGKCGGRELGYASDIELMFVYETAGKTSGPKSISNASFFEKLVQRFSKAIEAKHDGIFEVDMRLRPYGSAGSAAVEFAVFNKYFGATGEAWPFERQSLVKLRPIAGDAQFGRHVVNARDEIVYESDWFDKTAMLAMREKQIRQLVAPGTINAKLSSGGLVDCEYIVQALQIRHARSHKGLRTTNTRAAIDILGELGLVTEDQHLRLQSAHRFLRLLIDALRVVRGNARDLTVPDASSPDFAFLARHLGFGRDIEKLQNELTRTLGDVLRLASTLL